MMKRINDLVGFDNLKIVQNDDWFKFSLEAVLLPYFVKINSNCHNILDLCTGNAPIPLVLSTMTDKPIIGVEVQKDIYELAKETVEINHLEKQITIVNDNIIDFANKYDSDSFDIITCNPPYFKNLESSEKNSDIHKSIARHELLMNLEDVMKISRKLLKNGGKLYMVHRIERFIEVIDLLNKYHLSPKRVQFIYPKINNSANLFLIESSKGGKNGLIVEKPLIVHEDNGDYCDVINKMFKRM